MNTKQIPTWPSGIRRNAVWGAVALAILAALGYLLISLHVLAIGEFTGDEGPAGFFYVAAAFYLASGLLILTRRRWLWLAGALFNALVILFFIQMYASRPDVLFSPGGMVTKIAQLGLEGLLIYLIFSYHGRQRVNTAKSGASQ
jgi:hypothetical protein